MFKLSRLISIFDFDSLRVGTALQLRPFFTSPSWFGEPMKKKRRVDPGILETRYQRKRRRIEKEIRYLERRARSLKPIEEIEGERTFMKSLSSRTRKVMPLAEKDVSETLLLKKQWSRHCYFLKLIDHRDFLRALEAQAQALKELKREDTRLYFAAIEPDESLLPFEAKGPSETAPILNYEAPDGDYNDITPTFEGPSLVVRKELAGKNKK